MTERHLVVRRLDDVKPRKAPWPHYPHCPACHTRVVSRDPAVTRRSSGRAGLAHSAKFAGDHCPTCGHELRLPVLD